jgi:pectate lyase
MMFQFLSKSFSFALRLLPTKAPAHSVTRRIITMLLFTAFSLSTSATVLLDDTFADGTRNNQNLPTDSAWYVSSVSSWTTAVNAMSLTLSGSGAVQGVTYFGANSSSPVQLNVGDTLTATIKFTFNGVNTFNTSQNFRLGIFNFANSALSPTWATTDLSGNNGLGNGVQGYALFQTMGGTFNNASPMNVQKRTTLADGALLGSAGDYTSLGNGPGNTSGFPGFISGAQYLLQFSLQRTASTALAISVSWQNVTNGATLTTSVTDTSATNFNFDGIALRPSSAASSSTNIIFNEVRIDLISAGAPPSINTQPLDQSVFVGQSAALAVDADGTAPLSYQWYLNTNTLVLDATNATLTFTNAQLTNSGDYSLVVTNSFGSVTSDVATLTVSVPTAPSIVTQPQSEIVLPGQTATFTVIAGGSQPLNYQWHFNTNTVLTNATDSILTLTNVQVANAGVYSVVVGNLADSVTSSNATLSINTNPVTPVFTTQPFSIIAVAGGNVSFSALASGTAPISYQWNKNAIPILGATASTLNLTNVQTTNAGNYTVTASNSVGTADSDVAVLSVTAAVSIPNSAFNLTGFAQSTTGGGVIPDTDPAYKQVYTALDLANAVLSAYKTSGSVKVIEIMNDLDLGWNEVGPAVQTLASTPFRAHAAPKLHPKLLATGVSLIDIKPKSGLTIFSANGATIRHACFNVKSTANVIIRNLKFDEMWEWDEASKGDYDKNDWDFIDLGNGGTVANIWIDHCTFTKAYDGEVDIKQGSSGITFSWCKYTGDDGATNTNSWVRQQINYLEQLPPTNVMYNFLRSNGFSVEDIVTILQGHDKTHLIGANSLKAENALHTVTYHHDWFINPWDRLPRLRGGNVHNYNIYVDDTLGLAAKNLRNARVNASANLIAKLNNSPPTYNFNPFLNGSISTESGAVLVEKSVYKDCVTPLRNNQTDPSDSQYTGKIVALDTIYQFNTTIIRGNSTDPGNPLGPFQAAIIPFSWNLPGNQLPYSYAMDDPNQLQALLTQGAGAGVLNWNKTNWLLTSYAATAPGIIADPQDQTVAMGQSATFSIVATGSAPLKYQWYFNTNTSLAGATNTTLTLTNLQTTNSGAYSVVVSNSVSFAASAFATLTVNSGATGFALWQSLEFTPAQLADPSISGQNATPANDGVPNLVKYALGLAPFVSATQPLIGFRLEGGEGILSFNRPVSVPDVVYEVEVSTNLFNWSTNGVIQMLIGTNSGGLQMWEGHYSGVTNSQRFFRLLMVK